jgi:hypothetical protein
MRISVALGETLCATGKKRTCPQGMQDVTLAFYPKARMTGKQAGLLTLLLRSGLPAARQWQLGTGDEWSLQQRELSTIFT